MKTKNIVITAALVIMGLLVITEAFGPHLYWFNMLYFFLVLPAGLALSDIGPTMRPDLYDCEGTEKSND